MSNFYIGQEVVCVKSFPDMSITNGQIHEVIGIRHPKCFCGNTFIDVGIPSIHPVGKPLTCCCGITKSPSDGKRWFHTSYFAPLQTKSEESDMEESIKEALEKPLFV